MAERFHHRKAGMRQRLLQQVGHLLNVIGRGTGDKGRSGSFREFHHVEFAVNVGIRRGRRDCAAAGKRRMLAAGHAVNPVIHDNRRHFDIAAGGVDEMIPADGERVAVAHRDDHFQFRAAQLDAGRKGERPAMQRVKRMKIHVAGDARRTADPGHHHEFVFLPAEVVNRPQQGVQDNAMPAAGAPEMRKKSLPNVVFDGHVTPLFLE